MRKILGCVNYTMVLFPHDIDPLIPHLGEAAHSNTEKYSERVTFAYPSQISALLSLKHFVFKASWIDIKTHVPGIISLSPL